MFAREALLFSFNVTDIVAYQPSQKCLKKEFNAGRVNKYI